MKQVLLILILGISLSASSFKQSKEELNLIYEKYDMEVTFYCGCDYDKVYFSKNFQPLLFNPHNCGYSPKKARSDEGKLKARIFRVEWEHVIPRATFKNYPRYKEMEADMHNLRPAIGELNGNRLNYPYGIVSDEPRNYGVCDFEFENNIVEPREEIRGDIARTYFYFEKKYSYQIDDEFRELLKEWNISDPISDWERIRNKEISEIQGNLNPFIY